MIFSDRAQEREIILHIDTKLFNFTVFPGIMIDISSHLDIYFSVPRNLILILLFYYSDWLGKPLKNSCYEH